MADEENEVSKTMDDQTNHSPAPEQDTDTNQSAAVGEETTAEAEVAEDNPNNTDTAAGELEGDEQEQEDIATEEIAGGEAGEGEQEHTDADNAAVEKIVDNNEEEEEQAVEQVMSQEDLDKNQVEEVPVTEKDENLEKEGTGNEQEEDEKDEVVEEFDNIQGQIVEEDKESQAIDEGTVQEGEVSIKRQEEEAEIQAEDMENELQKSTIEHTQNETQEPRGPLDEDGREQEKSEDRLEEARESGQEEVEKDMQQSLVEESTNDEQVISKREEETEGQTQEEILDKDGQSREEDSQREGIEEDGQQKTNKDILKQGEQEEKMDEAMDVAEKDKDEQAETNDPVKEDEHQQGLDTVGDDSVDKEEDKVQESTEIDESQSTEKVVETGEDKDASQAEAPEETAVGGEVEETETENVEESSPAVQTTEGGAEMPPSTVDSKQPVQVPPPTVESKEDTVEAAAAPQEYDLVTGNDENGSANEPPPAPHLPSLERSHTSIEGHMSTSALNIVWSFGLNRTVPVLNLSDGVRQAIMYPCAHVGIMYDFKNNKQHILQAHLNPITCSAVSQDKRWLVTGDVGADAMVNIWDTYTGTPIQTMFDPNPQGGVVAVALTPDSRFLATLSALPTQTLAIWDWTVDGDVPICSADLKPEYGVQNFIYFDPTDFHHVVTNSETQVIFYHWADGAMEYYAPPLTDHDFNKPVGRYSQSLFQIGIARALTATSIGNLVVWDNNRPLSKIMDVNQSADKKPLKIIKVHDRGINVLTTTDEYIVIGDTSGHVKFFDQGLRLIYWYREFNAGPCTAISFAHMPDFSLVPSDGSKYPSDATKQAKPFVVRDFIVGTAIAVYCSIITDGTQLKIIHREHDSAVHALAAHPQLPIIAMGSYSGLLKLWNYRTKETVCSRIFEKCHIHSCTFDPKGFYIAVGCANGTVFLVDSVALLDQVQGGFKSARDCITHIAFSHNSRYMATADAGFTITVYKRQRKEGRNLYTWHGRYRSHYKPIRDLLFDVHLDTNEPKLLSLGEDRMLIEYDLSFVGKTNNKVWPLASDRIEQGAIPQCMTRYPPITKEHFFLTATDQYKLKCFNSTTKMCRKTVLGPTYGSPIRKMMVVPTLGDESANHFLAYITDDKVGLHFLPATGNPHLAMALIAHPSGISNLACSFDGAYLFTAGGPDFAVHMWEINIAALEAQAKLGGEDLVPFYGLLEGGRDGELYAELEDLFYYAQLRHQGINSTETRQIGNRVPISEVPFIMRAMGFYPSEQEIEDMLNEIKYDEYVNLGHYQEDVDLGQFIKLYVNHRPAFGLSPEKLLWAFETLAGSAEDGNSTIERGDLLDILQKNGEHMTEYELAEHLATLLGFNAEGGTCEQEEFDAQKAGNYIADALPFDVSAEIMINEILGFSITTDPPGADDTKVVVKSGAS